MANHVLIRDLYNAIERAINDFRNEWLDNDLELGSEDYFKALDSAISDIEVDSGLFDAKQIWKEMFRKECEERLKKIRGEI